MTRVASRLRGFSICSRLGRSRESHATVPPMATRPRAMRVRNEARMRPVRRRRAASGPVGRGGAAGPGGGPAGRWSVGRSVAPSPRAPSPDGMARAPGRGAASGESKNEARSSCAARAEGRPAGTSGAPKKASRSSPPVRDELSGRVGSSMFTGRQGRACPDQERAAGTAPKRGASSGSARSSVQRKRAGWPSSRRANVRSPYQ